MHVLNYLDFEIPRISKVESRAGVAGEIRNHPVTSLTPQMEKPSQRG